MSLSQDVLAKLKAHDVLATLVGLIGESCILDRRELDVMAARIFDRDGTDYYDALLSIVRGNDTVTCLCLKGVTRRHQDLVLGCLTHFTKLDYINYHDGDLLTASRLDLRNLPKVTELAIWGGHQFDADADADDGDGDGEDDEGGEWSTSRQAWKCGPASLLRWLRSFGRVVVSLFVDEEDDERDEIVRNFEQGFSPDLKSLDFGIRLSSSGGRDDWNNMDWNILDAVMRGAVDSVRHLDELKIDMGGDGMMLVYTPEDKNMILTLYGGDLAERGGCLVQTYLASLEQSESGGLRGLTIADTIAEPAANVLLDDITAFRNLQTLTFEFGEYSRALDYLEVGPNMLQLLAAVVNNAPLITKLHMDEWHWDRANESLQDMQAAAISLMDVLGNSTTLTDVEFYKVGIPIDRLPYAMARNTSIEKLVIVPSETFEPPLNYDDDLPDDLPHPATYADEDQQRLCVAAVVSLLQSKGTALKDLLLSECDLSRGRLCADIANALRGEEGAKALERVDVSGCILPNDNDDEGAGDNSWGETGYGAIIRAAWDRKLPMLHLPPSVVNQSRNKILKKLEEDASIVTINEGVAEEALCLVEMNRAGRGDARRQGASRETWFEVLRIATEKRCRDCEFTFVRESAAVWTQFSSTT